MPINDWWTEGRVECKEEGWQEMLNILPWLMPQVRHWFAVFCSAQFSPFEAQSAGGGGRLGFRSIASLR
jgi:hypothetical protein